MMTEYVVAMLFLSAVVKFNVSHDPKSAYTADHVGKVLAKHLNMEYLYMEEVA